MFACIAPSPSFTTVTDPCKASSVLATLSGSALCVARTRKSTLLMVSVVKIPGLTEIAEFYKKNIVHYCRTRAGLRPILPNIHWQPFSICVETMCLAVTDKKVNIINHHRPLNGWSVWTKYLSLHKCCTILLN